MGLFGSRDEDPLLQDDPFAPGADAPASSDDGASARSSESPTQHQEAAGPPETRAITCTQEEATDGALSDLNQALVGGWRLARVQLQNDGRFVFQLQRDRGASEQTGSII